MLFFFFFLQPLGSIGEAKHLAREQRATLPILCPRVGEKRVEGEKGVWRWWKWEGWRHQKVLSGREEAGDVALTVAARFGGRGTRKRKSLAFFYGRLCKQGGFLMVVRRVRGAAGRVFNPCCLSQMQDERVLLWRCYSIFLREGGGRKMSESRGKYHLGRVKV